MANSECKKVLGSISSIDKTDTEYEIKYETGETAKLNILNDHVFKYFMSPTGDFPEYPTPNNPNDKAKINSKKVSDYDKKAFDESHIKEHSHSYIIHTHKIYISFDKIKGTMTVTDKRTDKEVLKELKPLSYDDNKSKQTLIQRDDEHFFGGGMQNGRFTHKGTEISIRNTNVWVDGGVSSPNPFYWSNYGYGILRNTWQPGTYDFGSESETAVSTFHEEKNFDAFFFINPLPRDILRDYYELTGHPTFMPEYAFYEAHLNCFNRDYWVKVTSTTPGGILFEDGFYYKCYQPNQMDGKKGILESLNGEINNYQFSARAMIDRYKKHDVPLGWFVPNDGYGAGYGQTDSLDGDIENLRQFAEYAREKGVEVALWTESQLEPKDPENPEKGERDLHKEVKVAGVVALKCDVAWIGSGYSFGLNAVENAAKIFDRSTEGRVRTMIIMVDGWAGTQRYSGIWSGDQMGGEWEYIRFHIPTYIGSGLSGQPIVGSDMDGIYGGKSREVNIRDFQWKTFTPLQLNMDGWGWKLKTPFGFDEEATAINRAYLKLKSMLMPYNYTIGYESIHGLPMIRAMYLEFPKETSAYTLDSQYQFMWGPSILVAPIYNNKGFIDGSLRDGIYLPDAKQVWIDFFTGEKYQGGRIYNNIKTPLWKIPVFIKDGAIIPMVNPNNNPNEIKRYRRVFTIYPNGKNHFEVYEDDGISCDYLDGQFARTKISVIDTKISENDPDSNESGDLHIHIHKTEGYYKKIMKERSTLLQIMASREIEHIKAAIANQNISIIKAETEREFEEGDNMYYFKKDFLINPYFNDLGGELWKQKFLLIKIQRTDVLENDIHLKIKGYANEGKVFGNNTNVVKTLQPPSRLTIMKEVDIKSITLFWQSVANASYYEIERDGIIFTNIIGTTFVFEDLKFDVLHKFRIRSVNEEGVSNWSDNISGFVKNPYKNAVKGVTVTCNVPCERGEEIKNICNVNIPSIWHTNWSSPKTSNSETCIKIHFDLGSVYNIEKMEYTPRPNAGNGTILKLQYKYSTDGTNYSPLSSPVEWNNDSAVKTVHLNGVPMRFMEWNILDSVGGFCSGQQLLFSEKKAL